MTLYDSRRLIKNILSLFNREWQVAEAINAIEVFINTTAPEPQPTPEPYPSPEPEPEPTPEP